MLQSLGNWSLTEATKAEKIIFSFKSIQFVKNPDLFVGSLRALNNSNERLSCKYIIHTQLKLACKWSLTVVQSGSEVSPVFK